MAENEVDISSGNSEGLKNDKSTDGDNDSRYVFIKFVDQKGKITHLKVKRRSTFGAAFETYRRTNQLDVIPNFLYNGSRISSTLTPAELNFRNGEQVDVFGVLTGG